MGTFSLTYPVIQKIIEFNHFQEDLSRLECFFLALRGAIPASPDTWMDLHNEIEIKTIIPDYVNFNCTIIQVIDGKLSPFRATTLPGKTYLINPLPSVEKIGTARLLPGRHILCQGKHYNKYAAFRQFGRFPLLRDTNRDMDFDWDGASNSDLLVFPKHAGINLHYGTGDKIGKWSAGCQVINTDLDLVIWNEFRKRVYKGPPRMSETYYYYLFDAPYVETFSNASLREQKQMQHLMWGSHGQYVYQLQEKFAELDYSVHPDSAFGKETMSKGVVPYQRDNFTLDKVNGVVDIEMWNHLFND